MSWEQSRDIELYKAEIERLRAKNEKLANQERLALKFVLGVMEACFGHEYKPGDIEGDSLDLDLLLHQVIGWVEQCKGYQIDEEKRTPDAGTAAPTEPYVCLHGTWMGRPCEKCGDVRKPWISVEAARAADLGNGEQS